MMFLGAAKYSLEMHGFRMLVSHRSEYSIPSHRIALIDCTCGSCSVGDVERGLDTVESHRDQQDLMDVAGEK